MKHEFTCDQCAQSKVHDSSISTGYGVDENGGKVCFECCAINDRQSMVDDGHSKRLPLYLSVTNTARELTNWPGTLRFAVHSLRTSRHNIARSRTDVWFIGPDDHIWHGVQYGEFSQVCHCKRTKQEADAA